MIPFLSSRRLARPAMTLEGVLGPNSRLDEAAGMPVDGPDALAVATDGRLLFSAGSRVLVLSAWGGEAFPWATLDAAVTALCTSAAGLVAVGLEGGRISVLDGSARRLDGWSLPAGRARSVVDCVFRSEDELLLLDCGYGAEENVLAIAPWDDEARGQLLALRRSGVAEVVASGLHCPLGVCLDAEGETLVSLMERASIVDATGRMLQGGYPGYIGRLRAAPTGFVLACPGRRDPLIDFLKTERRFVEEMKAKIAPHFWIAPRANPEFSHDFPIELGATRLFGDVKPWAPSFSYGLLIEAASNLMPTGSWQSRADGRRHAICDAALWNGELIAVSKGSGEILNLGAVA